LNILVEKLFENNSFNYESVKKVRFSIFPSKIIIKSIAHSEYLRKIIEIG
jgi:hypothetical protein